MGGTGEGRKRGEQERKRKHGGGERDGSSQLADLDQRDGFTSAFPWESAAPIHWNRLRSRVLLAVVELTDGRRDTLEKLCPQPETVFNGHLNCCLMFGLFMANKSSLPVHSRPKSRRAEKQSYCFAEIKSALLRDRTSIRRRSPQSMCGTLCPGILSLFFWVSVRVACSCCLV